MVLTGIQVLTISATLLFLLFGITTVDADLTLQRKQEIKSLLELANQDATFAINQELKTEGMIELNELEALTRFAKRMEVNGKYLLQGSVLSPTKGSITVYPIPFVHYYVNFQNWQRDLALVVKYENDQLILQQAVQGNQDNSSGGLLTISVIEENGQAVSLSPKRMVGPSFIVVAYVKDQPLTTFLPQHQFPVVSVEEIKW